MALSEKLAKIDEAKRTEIMMKIKDTVAIEDALKVLEDAGIEATKEGSHSGNIRFKYVKHPEKKSVNIEYLLNNLSYN